MNMTVISENFSDITLRPDEVTLYYFTDSMREKSSHAGLITAKRVAVETVNGVATSPQLDPGPALVEIVTPDWRREYSILIPNSSATVALWPLIDAQSTPPGIGEPGFVRNSGGIARIQRMTTAEYSALAHKDPETLYVTFDN